MGSSSRTLYAGWVVIVTMPDIDPVQTQEWLEALDSLIAVEGSARAQFIISQLLHRLGQPGVGLNQAYINTIAATDAVTLAEEEYTLYQRLEAIVRWNAVVMVLRAGKYDSDIGGHLATYASAATLYEIGFNYFFRGRTAEFLGDLLYIQGHASPGIYARAFWEGRLSHHRISHFRQELAHAGVSSYPHPWLMPDFWQFATVSMGLGPIQAIYQAQMMRYLENRQLMPVQQRKVWMFCGDGEMDEPESLGAISVAGRERLNNLIFVINCNLQRLDGPVRGNGKIVKELESCFAGAGWRVIKVLWGSLWDELLADDADGLLRKRMDECLDGEYQSYAVRDAAFFRDHFFGKYPQLKERVADWDDARLKQLALNDGGHDPQKVYAAYHAAMQESQQPVVLLIKTIKGYGLPMAQGLNVAHQQKKATAEDLEGFRRFFNIPVTAAQMAELQFLSPDAHAEELNYLQQQRKKLGGHLPQRFNTVASVEIPPLTHFASLLESTGERQISTTMVFVRLLSMLLKDPQIGKQVVPIVPDESRTFGMEGLFRQIGIFTPEGQLYEPVDKAQVMYYREAKDGQYLEHGITEAGAMSSWIAAATAYSTHGVPLIPFYIFYSMFGMQRIGDLAWAAGDMRCRGFLLGATAGKTTLAGEGLQHDDGHSHLFSSVIPNCKSYDPAFSYELAVIMHDGLVRMYQQQEDVYYYITLMNENYIHPALPAEATEGIIKGLYLFQKTLPQAKLRVQLLGSGTILREVIKAAALLEQHHGIGADIWSVTSFTELCREAMSCERAQRLHPDQPPKISYVTTCLEKSAAPIIAATDYVRLVAEQIRAYIRNPYYVLGTDGFGRSDGRQQLRQFFEVDARTVAYTAVYALAQQKQITTKQLQQAMTLYEIDPNKADPWTI